MNILAVDNDPIALEETRKCLIAALAEQDVEVHAFHDPAQAAQYLILHKGDVEAVFASLLMRPIDGFQLLNLAHLKTPHTPVFLIGLTENWELRQLARLNGAAEYLTKPLTAEATRAVWDGA